MCTRRTSSLSIRFRRASISGPTRKWCKQTYAQNCLEALASLGKLDATFGAFYEQRRGYFSGLELASSADSTKTHWRSRVELEQVALEAAERGDMTTIESVAKELRDYKDRGEGNSVTSSVVKSRYECPVNLESPFPTDASVKARELGMVEHHFAAPSDVRAAIEVIYTHAWDPIPTSPELEHEGVLRTRVLAESKASPEFATEEFKVLGAQLIQQIFINSAGARYLPCISAETALVEDFPEDDTADAPSKLLAASAFPIAVAWLLRRLNTRWCVRR